MNRLLRLYPREWRERYGDELAAILEERPAGPSLVLDVIRGALDAHVRAARGRGSVAPGLAHIAAASTVGPVLSPAATPVVPSAFGWRDVDERVAGGMSRRQLLRRSLGAAVGLWVLEVSAGLIGYLWPNLSSGFGVGSRWATCPRSPQGRPSLGRRFGTVRPPTSRRRGRTSSWSTLPSPSGTATTWTDRARRPTSGRSTSAVRISAADPTSASRTTGSNVPATSRDTTGWGSRSGSSDRPHAAWIGSPSACPVAC